MNKLFYKIANRLRLYLFRLINYFLLTAKIYPKILDSHETIEQIVKNQLSISRFGDGELMIIRGVGWGFQKYDNDLAIRLIEVLQSNDPLITICIPNVFKDKLRLTDSAKRFWHHQVLENLYFWNKYTIKNKIYLDSLFTRFYMDIKDKDESPGKSLYLLKKIWNDKDILIIEGSGSRLGYQNDLFDNVKSIKRILCPPENAFTKYKEILDVSVKYAGSKLVLIALGMTATVLAYDLAKKNFRAIDIGHVDIEYEWFRMKANEKIPVFQKYMNEVGSREIDEIQDESYLLQIIAEINI